jgi:hypothetical protein
MDWLGMNKAQKNCFIKIMILQRQDGRRVIFRGEIQVIINCVILVMIVRKMMKKGSEAYLAFVMEVKKENDELANLFMVRKFYMYFLRSNQD